MICRQNIESRPAVRLDQAPLLPFSRECATDSRTSVPRVPGSDRTRGASPISAATRFVPVGPLVPEIPSAYVVGDRRTSARSPMSPQKGQCRLLNISGVPRRPARRQSPESRVSPNVPQVPHVPAVREDPVGCSISRKPQTAPASHYIHGEVPSVPSVPKVPGIVVPEVPAAHSGWAASFTSPRGQSARPMGPSCAAWGRSSGAMLCYVLRLTDTSCGHSATSENRGGKEGQRFLPVHQNPAKQAFEWLKNRSFLQKTNPNRFREGRPGDMNPLNII